MGETGGAALALGIWYQSIGAVSHLVEDRIAEDWKFDGIVPNIRGQSLIYIGGEQLQLVLEPFDMDAILRGQNGVELIQFKVSGQQEPRPFYPGEVREIFLNATRAILKYEQSKNREPVAGFIVASNRPIGDGFAALREAVRSLKINVGNIDDLEDFAKKPAPRELFTNAKSFPKTMREFAQTVIRGQAKEGQPTREEYITACLKAMACFAFTEAQHGKLEEVVRQWLRTWGILVNEYDGFIAHILGELLLPSNSGKSWNRHSIMQRVLDAPNAIPFVSVGAWRNVVKNLWSRGSQDPPTQNLIKRNGEAPWLLNRSDLLRGLPYQYGEDATIESDLEESYFKDTDIPPRIFALVGDGGNGKTSLMLQLFYQIARGMWDWEAEDFQSHPKFLGYPIIRAIGKNSIEAISGALKNWGRRDSYADNAITRFAAASRCSENDPAVWVGLDGIDETPEAYLSGLANDLANWAYDNTNVRFVLTCRPEHFRLMIKGLSENGLMRQIRVDEFSRDEAWQAFSKATNQELQLRPQQTRFATIGHSREATSIVHALNPGGFEASIRQPLFIGVIRRLYEQNHINCIQAAYNGETKGLERIATEYMYVFCERVHKRLNRAHIDYRGIFRALQQLAKDVSNTLEDNRSLWKIVCDSHLGEHIAWNILYEQCSASGLIMKKEGAGSFEWKHQFVGEYMPTMKENPTWP